MACLLVLPKSTSRGIRLAARRANLCDFFVSICFQLVFTCGKVFRPIVQPHGTIVTRLARKILCDFLRLFRFHIGNHKVALDLFGLEKNAKISRCIIMVRFFHSNSRAHTIMQREIFGVVSQDFIAIPDLDNS